MIKPINHFDISRYIAGHVDDRHCIINRENNTITCIVWLGPFGGISYKCPLNLYIPIVGVLPQRLDMVDDMPSFFRRTTAPDLIKSNIKRMYSDHPN